MSVSQESVQPNKKKVIRRKRGEMRPQRKAESIKPAGTFGDEVGGDLFELQVIGTRRYSPKMAKRMVEFAKKYGESDVDENGRLFYRYNSGDLDLVKKALKIWVENDEPIQKDSSTAFMKSLFSSLDNKLKIVGKDSDRPITYDYYLTNHSTYYNEDELRSVKLESPLDQMGFDGFLSFKYPGSNKRIIVGLDASLRTDRDKVIGKGFNVVMTPKYTPGDEDENKYHLEEVDAYADMIISILTSNRRIELIERGN